MTAEHLQLKNAYTGWAKKVGHGLVTVILSNRNRFKNYLLEDSLVNLLLNRY